MDDLTEIVKGIVEDIDLNISISSIVADKLFVCNTLQLTIGKIVKNQAGDEYTIIAFLNNKWLQVAPVGGSPVPYADTIVVAPDVTYFHGTPASVNNEYQQIESEAKRKTSFVWLLENYDEEFGGAESSVERNSKFRLFFLDEANEPKWTNEEHHRLVVQPQNNLIKAFTDAITANPLFKTWSTVSQKPRSRFGVYIENKGNAKKIIDEDLSGAELTINLEKFKCKNNC